MSRGSLAVSVLLVASGCATAPPARIQEAMHVVNRYLPEYVTEANKAFTATNHPDRERLTGIGDRMLKAVDALDRWSSSGEAAPHTEAQR